MATTPGLAPGALWAEKMLRQAAAEGASDVVFEPDDAGGYAAVLRRDGWRSEVGRCAPAEAAAVVGRIKALAQVPAYINDEPQDGSFAGADFAIAGHIRLAVLPTVRGQRLALRLPALAQLPALGQLGLETAALTGLREIMRQPDGLLLVSGPSGAGKTTTLHAVLSELVQRYPERAVVAIEDPVERRLDGVSHVAVHEGRGLDFLTCVRAALRQDVDVLVVGEVRDGETATACVRAALAGHLVLASVHAPRAVEVVPRLFEMGVAADLLLPILRGVLAQRLLRRRHAAGGRCLVADWIAVDDAARRAWRRGEASAVAKTCCMDQTAASLVAQGHTAAEEVSRILGYPAEPPLS